MSEWNGIIKGQTEQKHCSARYINEFVGLKCAPDMLLLKLFPNSKEITESFAAYRAVQRHVSWVRLDDPEVVCYCVGDGCTPRTAATFAFRSAWQCVSIDPRLRAVLDWEGKISRLTIADCTVEEATCIHKLMQGVCGAQGNMKVVIVAVHSHADLGEAVRVLGGERTAVVAIPCCVKQRIPWKADMPSSRAVYEGGKPYLQPSRDYEDWGVWSPKRRVLVWENLT